MRQNLESEIIDREAYANAVTRLRSAGVRLPGLMELAEPWRLCGGGSSGLHDVDPDGRDPRNLFRVHWHNAADRVGYTGVPEYRVLPRSLTGVDARIAVVLGNRFPMVRCHKVLAAYGCLVPRLITGQFDPTRHRAVWPSTGNYCRGGVAISRILGCRSVAVLPEGMSRERFAWLKAWVAQPEDILTTPGTESNVKEIYDACHALEKDPENIVLNQFSEFGNYVIHRTVTGPALERVFGDLGRDRALNCRAFVCASGSAGTLAAGDYLKQRLNSAVAVVEALECPTLLYNGYGEHNIQGIGDKHVPLIHNVMNTDFAVGVSDRACDALNLLFNTSAGRDVLAARNGIDRETLNGLADFGISSLANVVAAIKLAKYLKLRDDDVILTVATDGAEMYGSELARTEARDFGGHFSDLAAAETAGRYLLGTATDHVLELTRIDRERMFNLGYYTWVEQQGVSVGDFDARRDQSFWDGLMQIVPAWDEGIAAFNAATERAP